MQDRQLMERVRALEVDFDAIAGDRMSPAIEDLNWQLEDFRLVTFAQQVAAKRPAGAGKVSEKKIRAALRKL